MLLAAFVAALVVVADSVINAYADGHLLAAWTLLWALGFVALALSAGPARGTATQLLGFCKRWSERRAQRQSDAYLLALAKKDPRILADLEAAQERAMLARQSMDQALGRAWLARHPLGTFSASYQGERNVFRTTPLARLPTHLQYLQA